MKNSRKFKMYSQPFCPGNGETLLLNAWHLDHQVSKLLIRNERRSSTRGWLQENLNSFVRPTGGGRDSAEIPNLQHIYSQGPECRPSHAGLQLGTWAVVHYNNGILKKEIICGAMKRCEGNINVTIEQRKAVWKGCILYDSTTARLFGKGKIRETVKRSAAVEGRRERAWITL